MCPLRLEINMYYVVSDMMKCVGSMGIVQIALSPPPPFCQTGKRGKKVPQAILARPYTPETMWEKSALNHPGKPLHTHTPYWQCPYGNNTFQKGASLRQMSFQTDFLNAIRNLFPLSCISDLHVLL